MPNWCYSGITFYSHDEKEIKRMHQKFSNIYFGETLVPNGFSQRFMGDYVRAFFPKYDINDVNCRGQVTELTEVRRQDNYYLFQICTETAWDAKISLWEKIVSMFYPKVKIAYIAEECGNDYFMKWDETGRFYPEQYYIDGCLPSKDGGSDIYLGDLLGTHDLLCSIEELQNILDDNCKVEYKHSDSWSEVEANINEYINELDSADYCFTFEPYEERPPQNYNFLRTSR